MITIMRIIIIITSNNDNNDNNIIIISIYLRGCYSSALTACGAGRPTDAP